MTDKFGMGSLGMSPLAGVLDSMEFVKQAWSTLNLPTNLAPTMDVEEMDRRIADLKVVEQWLTMNLGMLRSSIQGMEIQRGTLVAMHAFGDAMSSSGEAGEAASRTIAAFAEMQRAATAGAAAGSSEARATAAPGSGAASTEPAHPGALAGSPEPAQPAQATPSDASPGSLAQELSRAAVSPTAWWNLLQSQFSQVAQAALAGASLADTVRSEAAGAPARGGGSRKGNAAPRAPAQSPGGAPDSSKTKPAKKRKAARSASKGRRGSVATEGTSQGVRGTADPAPRHAPAKRARAKGQG